MKDMNEEFELRNRIANADPAKGAPELSESVVASAVGAKTKRYAGFKNARFALGAASLATAALVVGITLPSSITPQPLFTVAAGSNEVTAASEDAGMSADRELESMIWPGWTTYEYIAGPGVSDETGSGEVFQGKIIGDPESLLERLASVFGVAGSVVQDQWSSPEYPSYSVSDGNISISTYFSGTGSWYYSNWSDNQGFACEGSSPEGDEEFNGGCEELKPTPGLIPTSSELTRQLTELSAQLGLEISTENLTIYRDDWGAYASWPYVAKGIETGLQNYANWGSNGELTYFASHSFELINRGSYDTVSAVDAVARISEGRWYGNPPESFYQNQVFASEDLARSTQTASEPPVEPEQPVTEPAPDQGEGSAEELPVIDEPEIERPEPQEPEIITLTITDAQATMLSVWDSNGGYWLVPGYVLFNDRGWFDAVISLPEGLIQLPEPMEIMPLGPADDAVTSEMID